MVPISSEQEVPNPAIPSRYLRKMKEVELFRDNSEKIYWEAVSHWVRATRKRYEKFSGEDLTQCFMRGPFAGWSEREVLELANRLCENAKRFPLKGFEDLEWE
jgi:hypothetical protein